MGILNRIFSTPEDGRKIVDSASKGLDMLFFTNEEKSQANQKLSDWYLKYLAATEGQNLSRRFIAIIIVFLWAILVVFGVAIRWVSFELSDFVFKVLTDVVMTPFSIVVGFYFLTQAIRTYGGGKKK